MKNLQEKIQKLVIFLNKPASKPPKESFIENFFFAMGTTVIFNLFSNLMVSSVVFLLGGHITELNFYSALFLTPVFCYFFCKYLFRRHAALITFVVCVLIVSVSAVSLYVSSRFYDVSYDGQAYHQETIIRLKEGWNPFYKQFSNNEVPYLTRWLNNYAKGAEIIGANFYYITNNIELSKVFNFVVLFGAFCLTLSTLLGVNTINKFWAFLISVVAVLNSVSLIQPLSFYVDGYTYSLLLGLMAVIVRIFYQKRGSLLTFVFCFPVLVNIKLSALVYGVIITSIFIGYLFNQYKDYLGWKVLVVFFLGSVLGILAIGFNPYITNTFTKGNPLWPAAGIGSIDYRPANSPPNFEDKLSAVAMVLSVFSKSDSADGGKNAEMKFPLTAFEGEDKAFKHTGPRVGGFGPLFSGAILLSLVGICLIYLKDKKDLHLKYVSLVILAILVSAVVNPTSSVARYVPQLWLLPILAVILFSSSKSLSLKVLGLLVVFVLLVNNIFVVKSNIEYNAVYTTQTKADLIALKNKVKEKVLVVDFGEFMSTRLKLNGFNINYIEQKKGLNCQKPKRVLIDNVTLACI